MDFFRTSPDGLRADGVSLKELAEEFGTPAYVYSHATLARHASVLKDGLSGQDSWVCYAVKANSNLSILRVMAEAGFGFDAVSLGELLRVRAAGLQVENCILSGVGKRDDEIRAALELRVRYISVESAEELSAINVIARDLDVSAAVSLRVNPEVDAKTHPYISTGLKKNKFGVAWDESQALVRQAREQRHTHLVGLSCHIGSQITELAPFEDAAKRLKQLVIDIDDPKAPLRYIGMGGGLGIPYQTETPPSPAAYGASLKTLLAPLGKTMVLEPGRVLVGNAGILLTRVIRQKYNGPHRFVLVDAGMNDLLRPALYQAHHDIEPVVPPEADATWTPADVVGPVCETADALGRQILLPPLRTGDLLAVRSAGAYGFAMASHYNARPKAAEVLCQQGRARLIRRRENSSELWEHELV